MEGIQQRIHGADHLGPVTILPVGKWLVKQLVKCLVTRPINFIVIFAIQYNGFLLALKLAPLTMLKAFTQFLDHEKVMPRSLGIVYIRCEYFSPCVIWDVCVRPQFFHPGILLYIDLGL